MYENLPCRKEKLPQRNENGKPMSKKIGAFFARFPRGCEKLWLNFVKSYACNERLKFAT